MLINILEQAFIFFPLVCAIYFSYIVLKITDISVDATMVLGAAVTAKLLLLNIHPIIATIVAIFAGFTAGGCVAFIQYKDKINDIISGLLMSFILYSINLNIMAQPHLMIMNTTTLVKIFGKTTLIMILNIITIVSCILIMRLNLGLKLRGFGENKFLMSKLGYNIELYRFLGLGISGALAAITGSMMSQIYGYADVNMGFGMAITAISAIVIGFQLSKKIPFLKDKLSAHHILIEFISCIIGVMSYFSIMHFLIKIEINPINFKLIMAIIIIFFLKIFPIKTSYI